MEKQDYYKIGTREQPVISNSSLSYINPSQGGSPVAFLDFFEEKQETEKSYLRLGSLIHKWAEDKDAFVIGEVDKPAEKLGVVADYALGIMCVDDDYDDLIFRACRIVGWNNGWGQAAIIKNAFPIIKPYLEEVIKVQNFHKTYLTKKEAETIIKCVAAVEKHPKASELLFGKTDEFTDRKIFKELEIFWSKEFSFDIKDSTMKQLVLLRFKAKLDNLDINFEAKEIIYTDPKTTSKNPYNFVESYLEYHYYRQIPFYEWAIKEFCKQQNINIEGFTFKPYNVVIETQGLHQVVVIQPDPKWMFKGKNEYQDLVKRIAKHTKDNQWNYSLEEFENDCVLKLEYTE